MAKLIELIFPILSIGQMLEISQISGSGSGYPKAKQNDEQD
jgi:hypothetical protein